MSVCTSASVYMHTVSQNKLMIDYAVWAWWVTKFAMPVFISTFVADFMDALSDPRAFLSNQEKRAEQLKAIGIEESDISTDGVIISTSSLGANRRPAGPGGPSSLQVSGLPGVGLPGAVGSKKPEEKEEFKFEAITADTLKQEKAFMKLMKKHQKELETLRKRQQKDRALVQKNQCLAFDKLVKGKGK